MELKDLTDTEFENLVERCFNDSDLMSSFVENNYQDFEDCMFELEIDTDYYCDYEFWYCELKDDGFIEFGFKKYCGDKNEKI